MSQRRLDAIGIVSSDLAASLRFYRLLGLALPEDPAGEDHIEVTLASGVRLMFDSEKLVRSFMPDWQPPSGGHRIGVAFHCGDAKGVDETFSAVIAAGFPGEKAPWDAFWGQRYAQLRDPDGNIVDLFAPLG